MSQEPFNLSPDLKRLREEGYFVQIVGGLLLMRDVPYVDSQNQVRTGTLISSLNMASNITRQPDDHVCGFDGDFPCNADGTRISQIAHPSGNVPMGTSKCAFSSRPPSGRYDNYYHKMTTYVAILSGPASVLKPGVTARTFRVPEADEASVFNYIETASDRVGIGELTARLQNETVAIIGLGGTGSYVLDFVAKTPAREIHLFDGDEFLQHNAFRAPGAPSLEELRVAPKKVDYLKGIYAKMHRNIVAHSVAIAPANINLLDGVTFAFICIDGGESKRLVVKRLEELNVPFVDTGMGLELVDGTLGGILRVTASIPGQRDHVHSGQISFAGGGEKDIYSSNIQVADLNALNAIMAIVKWKKIRGFYRDLERELHSTYTTDVNMLLNEDNAK